MVLISYIENMTTTASSATFHQQVNDNINETHKKIFPNIMTHFNVYSAHFQSPRDRRGFSIKNTLQLSHAIAYLNQMLKC